MEELVLPLAGCYRQETCPTSHLGKAEELALMVAQRHATELVWALKPSSFLALEALTSSSPAEEWSDKILS